MNSQDKVSLLRDTICAPSSQEGRSYDSVETLPQHHVQISFEKPKRAPQYIAALSANLSALTAGAVLGWTSPIMIELHKGHFHKITVDNSQMGWIGSFVTLGAMTMCFPTGFICDLLGRRTTLLLLTIPFCVGWGLILFAQSVIMLYFGRLITGMAVGACCVAAPLYTSEIAEKEIRGALGSYFQLMVTIGIFLAYIIGDCLSPISYTIFCSILPLIFFITFVFQPESPVYCLKKGKYNQALASLERLRGVGSDNLSELNEIEGALKENAQVSVSLPQTFRKKCNCKALLIAFGLMFFQQFGGINAIILYTSDIFKTAGVNLDANIAAIIVGGFQAAATFVSSLVIDKLGRRILLIISALIMALSGTFLAIFFSLKDRFFVDSHVLSEFGFVPVVALCVFVVVFSLGLGPIPWMISSEIFLPEVKSIATSAASTFNWFLAFLITRFYLQIKTAIGQDTTFYIFSFICLIGSIFVYFLVPETKNKTIDEIQRELEE